MFFPLIYWIVLPLLAAWFVIRWIKKTAPLVPPDDVSALFGERPLEKRWFRAVSRGPRGLAVLGDFEKMPDAVDRAYQGKEEAQSRGEKASFLVYNDKTELLEQVDS
jgi:hypothetical protein